MLACTFNSTQASKMVKLRHTSPDIDPCRLLHYSAFSHPRGLSIDGRCLGCTTSGMVPLTILQYTRFGWPDARHMSAWFPHTMLRCFEARSGTTVDSVRAYLLSECGLVILMSERGRHDHSNTQPGENGEKVELGIKGARRLVTLSWS